MEELIKCLKTLKWAKTALISVLVVLVGIGTVMLALVCMNENYIEFSVVNQSRYEIEYGSTEQMQPVTAVYKGTIFNKQGTPVEVSVEGQVEYDKLGAYELSYTASHKKVTGNITVTVEVKDTQAPVITLVSNPEHYTSPVGTYQEEGFSAIDNYDGDLTANVMSEEKDGIVTYRVTDGSGNEAVVERTIIYKDVIAPVLTLNGRTDITLYVGGSYAEGGYTATDECDGDITANVVVEGGVNTQQAGNYTVSYKVADSAGNVAETHRNVTVKNPIPATGDRVIYLTFDDGPCAYTAKLLDILDRYNVKATFFVTGAFPAYYNMIGEAHRRGHTIAIHTYSHVYSDIYSSVDNYLADFNRVKDVVVAQTGEEPWLFRFPGGTSNTVSRKYCGGIMTTLAQEMLSRGYEYCDWNVSSGDAGGATSEQQVINNVIGGISGKSTAVVLQHDIRSYSVDAVDDIIEWGINNGYVFKAMDRNTPFVRMRPQN